MKRRWWVELGSWEAGGTDDKENNKSVAVGKRIMAEISGVERSGGEPVGLVFRTWDEEEAKAVLEKAKAIVLEMAPDWKDKTDDMTYRVQRWCRKCHELIRWSWDFCLCCGTKLV